MDTGALRADGPLSVGASGGPGNLIMSNNMGQQPSPSPSGGGSDGERSAKNLKSGRGAGLSSVDGAQGSSGSGASAWQQQGGSRETLRAMLHSGGSGAPAAGRSGTNFAVAETANASATAVAAAVDGIAFTSTDSATALSGTVSTPVLRPLYDSLQVSATELFSQVTGLLLGDGEWRWF